MNVDFFICFFTDQLKLYYRRTSHQEVASSVFLSENISSWWDLWSYSREKCPRVLFHPDGDSKYFRFDGHKRCFHFRPRVLGSEKRFPTASDLCKDTLRTHCTIPLEKSLGESVLWVLLPYQLLPWVGEITVSDDFISLISRSQCFQQTQILKPSCGQKEEKTEPVCTFFRLMTVATLQPHKEMLLLSLGSKSHVKKNKCPCS